MDQTLKEKLISRIKSFAWRIGMMTVAFVIAIILENVNLLHLSPAITGVIGLALGEVSKFVNNYINESQG